MTIFNDQRLDNTVFKLDIERMRHGWYSDKYFVNASNALSALAKSGYRYDGQHFRDIGFGADNQDIGNCVVEMQVFTRRKGLTVLVGVDKALTMLRCCTGYLGEGGTFVETYDQLEVCAVHDGAVVHYPPKGNVGDGDPRVMQPVLKIRGRYRDFAALETPILGVLSRSSRIATNVYQALAAAQGKSVLFLPARFDAHEVQADDGYAYYVAVQRFNHDYNQDASTFISTDAQGDYWNGRPGATVPHSFIACFMGDTAAAMVALASTLPVEVPRVALVDFNNDSVIDSLRTLVAMFDRYRELIESGDKEAARRHILFGVRLDTSGSVRDVNVPPSDNPELDLGVTPRLVFIVREALNRAWESWNLPSEWEQQAREYCRNVKIIVSGGFSPERICCFERQKTPVDYYGVGSALMSNDMAAGTNTDFTADVVRVRVLGKWVDMAKVGRAPCDNQDLNPVN